MKLRLEQVLNSIKRTASVGLLASCLALSGSSFVNTVQAQVIIEEIEEKGHQYNREDTELIKYLEFFGMDAPMSVSTKEVGGLSTKPQFYNGELPIAYSSVFPSNCSSLNKLFDKFDGFINCYVYNNSDNRLVGVLSVKGGMICAEAIIEYVEKIDENNRTYVRMQAEEFHFNDKDSVSFHCVSEYNSIGLKISESRDFGNKLVEYFYLIPQEARR
jgi:hypothetical protein